MIRSLLLIAILASCAPKSATQSSSEALTFDEIDIPIDGTALIGTIESVEEGASGLNLSVKVASMKQGGSGSPIFSKGTSQAIRAEGVFLRNFEEKHGQSLSRFLQRGDQVLLTVIKDMRTQENIVTKVVKP